MFCCWICSADILSPVRVSGLKMLLVESMKELKLNSFYYQIDCRLTQGIYSMFGEQVLGNFLPFFIGNTFLIFCFATNLTIQEILLENIKWFPSLIISVYTGE